MNMTAREQRRARHPSPQGFAASCGLPPLARARSRGRRRLGMTDDPFVAHRSLLFTVAYEMLGSAADAEDVVQETWLRWADVGPGGEVRDPRAYLVRIVTRQALNRLRTLARRREDYVGEWLPEPLLTSPGRRRGRRARRERVDRDAHRAGDARRRPSARSSCCARCSTCRTTRSPRPWASRPRRCGRSRTGRASTWRRAARGWRSSRTEQQQVVERFLAALTTGDLQGLLDVLAPDVVVGRRRRRPGAGRPAPDRGPGARGGATCPASPSSRPACEITTPLVNGARRPRGSTRAASSTRRSAFVVEDGRITRMYAMRNPHKLGRLDEVAELRR